MKQCTCEERRPLPRKHEMFDRARELADGATDQAAPGESCVCLVLIERDEPCPTCGGATVASGLALALPSGVIGQALERLAVIAAAAEQMAHKLIDNLPEQHREEARQALADDIERRRDEAKKSARLRPPTPPKPTRPMRGS